MKGAKKPWSKVGKLEARIKQLEETIDRRHRHYCVDFKELTDRDNEIREHFNKEIELLHTGRNIVLRNLRKTIDNLIDPGKKDV